MAKFMLVFNEIKKHIQMYWDNILQKKEAVKIGIWYRSIGILPPQLVQRCNGTTAGLGLLEVIWVGLA